MTDKVAYELQMDDGDVTYYAHDFNQPVDTWADPQDADDGFEFDLELDEDGDGLDMDEFEKALADEDIILSDDEPFEELEEEFYEEPLLAEEEIEMEHMLDDAPQPQPEFDLEDEEDPLDFLDRELNTLPGADTLLVTNQEPERVTNWVDDGDPRDFIPYMIKKLQDIPPHSGQTTVGCEKAISYLRKLDKEISKAIQNDDENVIDEQKAEKLRDKIHEYIEMLEDAYSSLNSKKRKHKKKASFSLGKTVVARLHDGDPKYFISVTASDGEERLLKVDLDIPDDSQVQAFMDGRGKGLTKEAGNLMTFVDPFLQSITRLLMRSHITHGRNLQDVYAQLNEQYDFTTREALSIHELLLQKGLPLNVDLGRLGEKDVHPSDGKGVEYGTEYYS